MTVAQHRRRCPRCGRKATEDNVRRVSRQEDNDPDGTVVLDMLRRDEVECAACGLVFTETAT